MKANLTKPLGLFSIDVEEYFHLWGIRGVPPLAEWDAFPGRVESNLRSLFELLAQYNVKATCFFLGYVVKKYPHLVKEATASGHEVASHGMYHQFVYEMQPDEFLQDITDSRHLLEDITGKPVNGYRSPCFSVNNQNPWMFEKLVEAGYQYDSSVFPAKRHDGGFETDQLTPHWIDTAAGKLFEYPISVADIFGRHVCFSGGGYLRLFPGFLINNLAQSFHAKHAPVLFYIHPREIDPDHPRLKVDPKQHFRSYYNLKSVRPKLESIFTKYDFRTCSDYMIKISKEQ